MLPFNVAWNWLIILHFGFAGIATYIFLRYLNASRGGALLGGNIFMLSGYLLSVHNVPPHLFSAAWFPLVLTFFLKYFETSKHKYLILSSLCLVMQFVAGAPEMVIMSALVLLVLTAFPIGFVHSVSCGDIRMPGFFPRLRSLSLVGVLVFLLSAVQLFPFLELKSLSIRAEGLGYREAVIWSFSLKDVIQFVLNDPFGYYVGRDKYWLNQAWLKSLYLGVSPFVLSISYMLIKDKKKYIFLFLAAVSFILALGGNTPLFRLLYHLPVFDSMRYPVKFLFLFFFFISVTSSLGLDRMRAFDRHRRTVLFGKLCLLFALLAAIVWGYMQYSLPEAKTFLNPWALKLDVFDLDATLHNVSRFLFFCILFCFVCYVSLEAKSARVRHVFLALIVLLVVVDMFTATNKFYRYSPWGSFIEKHHFEEEIGRSKNTGRYVVAPEIKRMPLSYPFDRKVLAGTYASLHSTFTTDGLEVLKLKQYGQVLKMLEESVQIKDAKRFFDMMGIGYVVTWTEMEAPDFKQIQMDKLEHHVKELMPILELGKAGDPSDIERIVEKFSKKTLYLYEYLNSPGRYFLVSRVHYVMDERAVKERLMHPDLQPAKEVVVLSDKEGFRDYGTVKGQVELVSYKPNSIHFKSTTDNDSFFYLSDTYYPGWRAYIDGKPTKIFKANLAFRAVEVPKGKHTVVFKYVPTSFYAGLIFTLIGIGLSIWLIVRKR
jgi:hypothetical protein